MDARSMQKYGGEVDSAAAWEGLAQVYGAALDNQYHQHRLAVIRALIPGEVLAPGRQVFDFGCGDAVLFEPFLAAGATVRGSDVSEEMIALAKARLTKAGRDPGLAVRGGVEALRDVGAGSIDALMSFNVLAYLTDAEEAEFYREAKRVVKPGGYLIVTHSNELFDMFSLNRYTVEFFNRHFIQKGEDQSRVASLLTASGSPKDRVTYNVRENPLAYRFKLLKSGFRETRQEFINRHLAPPRSRTNGPTPGRTAQTRRTVGS